MKRRALLLAACMGVPFPCGAARAQARFPFAKQTREQTQFSAEDETVDHPIAVPPQVLEMLRKDSTVKNALELEHLPPDQMPLEWFAASTIHLQDPDHPDLMVEARAKLAGANICMFWVFLHSGDGFKQVFALPAHDLIIEVDREKGYKTLQAVQMTGLEITAARFRYNGKQYVQFKSKTEQIR